jgi:hypothetical protein
MVRQAFDLLGRPVSREHFEGFNDAGMEPPTPLVQQTPVRDLVGQGVKVYSRSG